MTKQAKHQSVSALFYKEENKKRKNRLTKRKEKRKQSQTDVKEWKRILMEKEMKEKCFRIKKKISSSLFWLNICLKNNENIYALKMTVTKSTGRHRLVKRFCSRIDRIEILQKKCIFFIMFILIHSMKECVNGNTIPALNEYNNWDKSENRILFPVENRASFQPIRSTTTTMTTIRAPQEFYSEQRRNPITTFGSMHRDEPILRRMNWNESPSGLIDRRLSFRSAPLYYTPIRSFRSSNFRSIPFMLSSRQNYLQQHLSDRQLHQQNSPHWPEMPQIPEFPSQDNPLTARGMYFRKFENVPTHERDKKQEREKVIEDEEKENEERKEYEEKLKNINRKDLELVSENRSKKEEIIKDSSKMKELEEKMNTPLNNRNVDESENKVISAAEEDNKRLKLFNKSQSTSTLASYKTQPQENERRISRRRLIPIEYEPEEEIVERDSLKKPIKIQSKIEENDRIFIENNQKNIDKNKNDQINLEITNQNQKQQPALIATRLSELYPNHVEAKEKIQNKKDEKDNNVNKVPTKEKIKLSDLSSSHSSSSSSSSSSGSGLRFPIESELEKKSTEFKNKKVPTIEQRDKAESKLNTNSQLPTIQNSKIPIAGGVSVAQTNGETIEENDKDKAKLVEKEYSNRDRGFGFVKAWAWDRAENYNVKDSEGDNNKNRALKETKMLTSDRFMNKLLKPTGL